MDALANDQPLEPRYRDHALTGEWKDHRDCHIKPDLVLIYQKPTTDWKFVTLSSRNVTAFLQPQRFVRPRLGSSRKVTIAQLPVTSRTDSSWIYHTKVCWRHVTLRRLPLFE